VQFKNKYIQKIWRFSTSFNLGIPVMIGITALIMWGTIVESKLDAWTAGQVVYRSWMMYLVMGLLVYNLAMVMIDRLPWKKNHYPFLLVHIGIIMMIVGGWVTQKFGIDGSMPIGLKSQSNLVTVSETDFVVYATFDGDRYSKIYDTEVNFFKNPPTKEKPFEVLLSKDILKITDYVPYAKTSKKIIKDPDLKSGTSIKIQLTNANVKQVETLTQPTINKSAEVNLGPLKVYLGHDYGKNGRKKTEINEIYLNRLDAAKATYAYFDKNEKKAYAKGVIEIGQVVPTHWMGLELRVLDYLQSAREEWDVKPSDHPTPLTTAVIFIEYKNRKEWLLLNDVIKIFDDQTAYLVSFQNRRLQLDFPIKLNEFKIDRYQGAQKVKEYSSQVTAGTGELGFEKQDTLISMNEPMKYKGYTFYQASFQQDEQTQEPTASILSVNKDPGRPVKYIGSLILTLGILWLFYQRRKRKTAT
jgi:hypothetical protein